MRVTECARKAEDAPSRVTLTNAHGDEMVIIDGDPLAPVTADEAVKIEAFLARCAGWSVEL